MVPINQGVIAKIGYDTVTGGTFIIEFENGISYAYHEVPYSVYCNVLDAEDPDWVFANNIIGKYDCNSIDMEEHR